MDAPRPTSELAADVRRALVTLPTFADAQNAEVALDALVARVTDLEAQVREWNAAFDRLDHQRREAEAQVADLEAQVVAASDATALRGFGANKRMRELEAQVAALTQERDECERQYQSKVDEVIEQMNRAEAAEADANTQHANMKHWREQAKDAEAQVAALTQERDEAWFEERHSTDAAGNARVEVWCRRCGVMHQAPAHCPNRNVALLLLRATTPRRETMADAPPRPEGPMPGTDQKCPLCGSKPFQPHEADCPWQKWAEGLRAGDNTTEPA